MSQTLTSFWSFPKSIAEERQGGDRGAHLDVPNLEVGPASICKGPILCGHQFLVSQTSILALQVPAEGVVPLQPLSTCSLGLA